MTLITKEIIIIKCRDIYKTLATTNTKLLVTLHNGWKPLTNIKKMSISDAVKVLYMPQKWLIHHLTWWIGVDHVSWILCLKLFYNWFSKNTCIGNINQHNKNNNSNNNNNNCNNMIIRLKLILERSKKRKKHNQKNKKIFNKNMKHSWLKTPLSLLSPHFLF